MAFHVEIHLSQYGHVREFNRQFDINAYSSFFLN